MILQLLRNNITNNCRNQSKEPFAIKFRQISALQRISQAKETVVTLVP